MQEKVRAQMPWGGKRPTNQECLQACIANAESSARLQSDALAAHMRAPQGSQAAEDAHWDYSKHAADQAHWREMANWYRGEIANEAARAKEAQKRDEPERPLSARAELGGGLT